MNREYKNIEIKTFVQKILQIFIAAMMVGIFVCTGIFFTKLHQIDINYDINNHIHEIMLDNQELMLNIERPSIYANFENSGKKLSEIDVKTNELIQILKNNKQLNANEEEKIKSSIEKLKQYIKDFNSLLGTSGSDFKSFNVLYSQSKLVDVKQNVLEYIFATKISVSSIKGYIEFLDSLIENNTKQIIDYKTQLIELKQNYAKTKLDKDKEYIELLEDKISTIDDEKTYLILSRKLLDGVKKLHEEKNEIKNFTDFENILTQLKLQVLSKIEHLEKTNDQLVLVGAIFAVLLIFTTFIIFKYSLDLTSALNILYKAFLNSPIQQVLINTKNKKNLYAEYVNDTFTFNVHAPTEQSESIRKAQAVNFYDSLDGIIDLTDSAKGFDYGTLIQESHSKIQAYNENDITSRKETRFFSVFRKNLGDNIELINKVDVTKKILQIKDYKTKLDNMQKKLDTDSLTGLLSLQALQDRELKDDKANKNNIFLYLKIDNFNDLRLNYSTIMIDEIIKIFANSLKNALNVKNNDEVLKSTSIYHLQLDEFCIVYKNHEEAMAAADLIQNHFKTQTMNSTRGKKNKFELKINSGMELKDLELNIGISSERDIRKSNQEIINRLAQAILASYETIKTKEPYCVYKEGLSIEKQHAEQQRVVGQIRYALENDKIFVVCQGVHNSITKEVSYYEVLVRLRDEHNNIVSPGLFLDVARKVGLYKDIQEVVINKVFDLIEQYPNANFSINLANSDIINKETRDVFEGRLEKCSRPEALCVEILESESIDKYDDLSNFLKSISFRGCKIAIDDFGSGYSNFYRLLKIKFDYLKIDGSIIESLVIDNNARTVLETLVGFAHKQGYEVVAEFVKNQEILKIVQDYGIEKAQGYELSKPEEPHNIFI
ncbi:MULTISPECIES: GGDEF domain-containing phosphodiesterase [unclassified Campylobacter]|uniref:EAL domain-containing protein n=1 Tax=unclassified Campylobacter TaxID=2593542 RepID=UPI001BDAE040|nr:MULTISPECIES: GGDEF domain-containing phosphodiesterase [unclassified Campylobacter]MBT0879852.1 EAL domain-containing protein [Campylobacter sp. 2018MI27]MBT0884082.1 EAL domain-containing protein [Campylobacter sp. 2018MI10]